MKKEIFIKITAWLSLICFGGIGISIISLIFIIPFWVQGANLSKLIILDLVFFVIGTILCLIGVGIFEFLRTFVRIEKEVAEIEEKVNLKVRQQ
jgi:hypothetical protein